MYTSINALIGLQIKSVVPNKKLLSTSIIMGMILPDLDLVLDYLLSLFLKFNFLNESYIPNSIFHSLFMIPFLSLLILIYLEYKNKKPPNIGPIIVPIRKLDSNLANFLVRLDLSEISAI